MAKVNPLKPQKRHQKPPHHLRGGTHHTAKARPRSVVGDSGCGGALGRADGCGEAGGSALMPAVSPVAFRFVDLHGLNPQVMGQETHHREGS